MWTCGTFRALFTLRACVPFLTLRAWDALFPLRPCCASFAHGSWRALFTLGAWEALFSLRACRACFAGVALLASGALRTFDVGQEDREISIFACQVISECLYLDKDAVALLKKILCYPLKVSYLGLLLRGQAVNRHPQVFAQAQLFRHA